MFYDDNANFGPSSRLVDTLLGPLELATESRPRDSWGLSLGGSGAAVFDAGRRGEWLIRGSFTGYANWLFDAADQEIEYARVELGPRCAGSRRLWDFPLTADYLGVGHDPYMWRVGFGPSPISLWSERWDSTTRASAEWREFREETQRDGMQYCAAQTVRRWLGRSRHNVALTLAGYFEDAEEKAQDVYGVEAQLSGELRLARSTSLAGVVQYRAAHYRERALPALQDADRSDHQWQFGATLTQALTKRVGL